MRLGLWTAALAALLGGCVSGDDGARGLDVKEIGSFHVGGRQAELSGLPVRELIPTAGAPPFLSDPNGEFEVEQMYVHYTRLSSPKARHPLLMWHGGGLTGVTWETKPDGQPGWQMYFLNAGHDTYVSDAVERGRASWARYPEVFATEPFFRSKNEAWELFRIGPKDSYDPDPARRVAHPGQRFPTDAFDQFSKQGVPRWATNDAATQRAYDALVQRVCPCVIVVHSQGGNFAFNAALNAPDKIKGIVAVEPSGAPNPANADAAKLSGVPHLFVWGDYLDEQELWQRIRPAVRRWHEALRAAGVNTKWMDLPKMNIAGNTHMLMMDTNSDQIAALIQAWMMRQGLMK